MAETFQRTRAFREQWKDASRSNFPATPVASRVLTSDASAVPQWSSATTTRTLLDLQDFYASGVAGGQWPPPASRIAASSPSGELVWYGAGVIRSFLDLKDFYEHAVEDGQWEAPDPPAQRMMGVGSQSKLFWVDQLSFYVWIKSTIASNPWTWEDPHTFEDLVTLEGDCDVDGGTMDFFNSATLNGQLTATLNWSGAANFGNGATLAHIRVNDTVASGVAGQRRITNETGAAPTGVWDTITDDGGNEHTGFAVEPDGWQVEFQGTQKIKKPYWNA